MKYKNILLPLSMLLGLALVSCSQDDGNYDYISNEEAGEIKFDTIGIANHLVLNQNLSNGQHIEFEPNVKYRYPERLRYAWFYITLTDGVYSAVQKGNSLVYEPGDTICRTKKLDWVVDLKPGTYRFYCMAEDTVTGMRGYYQAEQQYVAVASSGNLGGLYLLTERDGQTDIEVYRSGLMLIYGSDSCFYDYYHKTQGHYLEGKPLFINGTHTGKSSKDGYLVATDKNLYRLAADGLGTVNDWSTMFYNTPDNFNPQAGFYTNFCDFLINDGKLHVLYASKANDCKFSAPIAGDYEAYPFLMKNTSSSWRHVEGAIDAWQVIYDQKNRKFRPYYSRATSMSQFKQTVPTAVVDANNVPGDIKAIFQGGGNYTCVVTNVDGTPYLYRYTFYNVVDNGDLSAAGSRSIIDLSGCTDISNAKRFESNTTGYAFYYATDNAVYSFSASSGSTTSNTLYTCQPGETVTALYAWGSNGGGWPTSDCALWIGVWDNNKNEGKLIQYEMDVNYGLPNSYWGPMFGAPDNPVVTTGWGKIVDMCNIDAE
jgi:hypothetical protein